MGHVTGIGSLPHDDAAAAAEFVASSTTVPYLPQLPQRHQEEGMLLQWGDGLCGCGGATGSLRHGAAEGPRGEAFVGAQTMLESLAASRPALIKTQATGPVTLAVAMRAAGHPGPGLIECLLEGLRVRIRDHLASIRRAVPHADVVLLFDEPVLGAVASAPRFPVSRGAASELLAAAAADLGCAVGVHCCAETDWGWIAGLGFDALSWDLMSLGPSLGDAAEPIARAIAAGATPVWGVVQPAPFPAMGDNAMVDTFRTLVVELMVAGAPHAALVTDAWFTPACGLAGVNIGQAEWVMDQVRRFVGGVAPDEGL